MRPGLNTSAAETDWRQFLNAIQAGRNAVGGGRHGFRAQQTVAVA